MRADMPILENPFVRSGGKFTGGPLQNPQCRQTLDNSKDQMTAEKMAKQDDSDR